MNPAAPPPLALIAELTHRCPLACPYCSNPLELIAAAAELETATWTRLIDEAAALGVLHLHLTGGEPMARRDLLDIIAHAHRRGLYINLITAGVTLDAARLAALHGAGLDHIQLSFQDAEAEGGDRIGGLRGGHARKLAAARLIAASDIALTLNFVVHRANLDRLPQMIALAEELGAQRMEIAHTQYHGWAMRNRAALLPSAAQLDAANATVAEARTRLGARLRIDYVVPDYFAEYPKACMGGWARNTMLVDPAGRAMPCHAADSIPGMDWPRLREMSLADAWNAPAFERYRGTGWMPEPCRSCDRREIDWGGCRCQALALTGDAGRTDPVCVLSPDHALVMALADAAGGDDGAGQAWRYRSAKPEPAQPR